MSDSIVALMMAEVLYDPKHPDTPPPLILSSYKVPCPTSLLSQGEKKGLQALKRFLTTSDTATKPLVSGDWRAKWNGKALYVLFSALLAIPPQGNNGVVFLGRTMKRNDMVAAVITLATGMHCDRKNVSSFSQNLGNNLRRRELVEGRSNIRSAMLRILTTPSDFEAQTGVRFPRSLNRLIGLSVDTNLSDTPSTSQAAIWVKEGGKINLTALLSDRVNSAPPATAASLPTACVESQHVTLVNSYRSTSPSSTSSNHIFTPSSVILILKLPQTDNYKGDAFKPSLITYCRPAPYHIPVRPRLGFAISAARDEPRRSISRAVHDQHTHSIKVLARGQ